MLQPSLPWESRRTFATAISRCSRQLPALRPCWRLCLDRRELRLGELTETATAPLQLFECTHFDDTTVVEHEDACRVADGGEPVGDDECGAVLHHFVKRRQDARFGGGIKRAGRFVENEDGWVLEQRPCD